MSRWSANRWTSYSKEQEKGIAAAAQLGLRWPLPDAKTTWAVIVVPALREQKTAFETLVP